MTISRLYLRLPNWLGDLLMSRPLLHALRAAHPESRITAVGPAAALLIERERLWDEWQVRPGERSATPSATNGGYDAALVLPPSFSSAWRVPRATPVRIGFAGQWRSPLLTHAMPRRARGEMHLGEEYLNLGERLGVRRVPVPSLAPTSEETTNAVARLEPLGFGRERFCILGPGAAYGPAKRWPLERYAQLGRRFVASGIRVLTCGAAEDRAVAAPLADEIGEGAATVCGETTLGEQLALCSLASVTVANDSGLAHLAAAAGAPAVVIFGSTSSAWTAPVGERVRVVQRAPVCSPCFQRTCRIGYGCLEAVRVDDVERAVAEVTA